MVYFVSNYRIDGVENYATIQECVDYLSTLSVVGLDIETSKNKEVIGNYNEAIYRGGLDPYLSNIVMIQVGDENKLFVIDVRDFSKEELQPLTDFLHWNKEVTFVGVNLKFESKHLKHKFDIDLYKVHDCMITEICLTNGMTGVSYSLASLAGRYLGVPQAEEATLFDEKSTVSLDADIVFENEFVLTPYELADNEEIDKSTRLEFVNIGDRPFTKRQVLYGANDIIYPLKIREFQLNGRRLDDGSIYLPKKLFNLENNVVMCLADMELNGMPIDSKKWIELAEIAEENFELRKHELDEYVKQFYPEFVEPPNLFDYEPRCTIEWTSSKQVIKLFKKLEIAPQEWSKQTKKKEYTVGATALSRQLEDEMKSQYDKNIWTGFDKVDGKFVEDNKKLILNYLLMKKSEQQATTFGREWLRYVHPITGKIHSNYRQILSTGRMSSTAPNMQNLPRGVYRDPFSMEDGLIASADFKNQEMRTAAVLSKEQILLDFFIHGDAVYGDDLHMSTANKMNKTHHPDAQDLPSKDSDEFNDDINNQRDKAKIIGFSILYGKDAKGFAVDWNLTEDEANIFVKGYLGAYPTLSQAMIDWRKRAFVNQYIISDETLDRRWFSDSFARVEELNEEVRAYYPEEYFTGRMPKEEKVRFKEELYEIHPHVRDLWREYFGLKGTIERRAVNYLVQGTSGGESKSAMVLMRRKIIEQKLPFYLCNAVHDEVLLYTTDKTKKEELREFMVTNMVAGANLFLDPPIMESDCEVGDKWIH